MRAVADGAGMMIWMPEWMSNRAAMVARGLLVSLMLALCAMMRPALAADCRVGAYALDADGTPLDIAPSRADTLRWRRIDGASGELARGQDDAWTSTRGWTGQPDGHRVAFHGCDRLEFDGKPAHRIALSVRESTFAGRGGTRLAGRLVLPPGEGEVPIVVLVHGSEIDSALDWDWMQRLLPAAGVGAFVYDKRGTGRSQGTYTQDFDVLADDAVAAANQARRLAGARAGRIGFRGASQGGWVAPLAAARTHVDFAIVVFGLAVSPLQEDHEAVEFQMRAKGHGDDEIRQAWAVSDAAGAMVASGFERASVEAFIAARAAARGKPWYPDLRGNITQVVLPMPDDELRKTKRIAFPMSPEELRVRGPVYVVGTPFHYDPMPVLRATRTPQLWVLGGQDQDAPSAETLRRLQALADAGAPIATALFPHGEHGMTEVASGPEGEPVAVGYPSGYLRMLLDFARDGRLHDGYGDAVLGGRRGR